MASRGIDLSEPGAVISSPATLQIYLTAAQLYYGTMGMWERLRDTWVGEDHPLGPWDELPAHMRLKMVDVLTLALANAQVAPETLEEPLADFLAGEISLEELADAKS